MERMSVVIRLKVPIEMHYTVIPMGTSKVNSSPSNFIQRSINISIYINISNLIQRSTNISVLRVDSLIIV